ncbi:hypothetical protein XI09_42155 [Bradyrhizobium sp. CCBAU 11386]|nr:hypothetical protein [Bradyrhizobium sp. CCBAU 11386]
MTLEEIPNVLSATPEIEAAPDGTVRAIVVVETDLEINATHPNYHKGAVDRLLQNIYNFSQSNPHHAQTITIRTRR